MRSVRPLKIQKKFVKTPTKKSTKEVLFWGHCSVWALYGFILQTRKFFARMAPYASIPGEKKQNQDGMGVIFAEGVNGYGLLQIRGSWPTWIT